MRDHVRAVLHQTGGNISQTAATLGIARNTLRSHMKRLGLRPGGGPPDPRTRPAPADSALPPLEESAGVPAVEATPVSAAGGVLFCLGGRLITVFRGGPTCSE